MKEILEEIAEAINSFTIVAMGISWKISKIIIIFIVCTLVLSPFVVAAVEEATGVNVPKKVEKFARKFVKELKSRPSPPTETWINPELDMTQPLMRVVVNSQ